MKRKTYLQLALVLAAAIFTTDGYAQQRTALQKRKLQYNYYRKTLQVDSAKAEQVTKVQGDYKAAMKTVDADTALNDAEKRVRIRALMEDKNRKLEQLLTPAQQQKIIPTSERAARDKQKPKSH